MSTTHTGSCLCGQARFEVEGDFERFFLCHCSRCRKGTGSAHGANLFSGKAKLKWLAGEDSVRTFRVKGTRHQKAFCPDCGSAMPYTMAGGSYVIVPAGSLDTPVDLAPDGHIFFADRADWYERLSGAPRNEGFPAA